MAKIKKGDLVKVMKGRARNQLAKIGDSIAAKPGVSKVIKVDLENNRVWVEGLNLVHKHKKPDKNNQKGRIVEIEAPIDLSNVQLVEPKSNKPTRVGYKVLDNGVKVRVAKCNNEVIDE